MRLDGKRRSAAVVIGRGEKKDAQVFLTYVYQDALFPISAK